MRTKRKIKGGEVERGFCDNTIIDIARRANGDDTLTIKVFGDDAATIIKAQDAIKARGGTCRWVIGVEPADGPEH